MTRSRRDSLSDFTACTHVATRKLSMNPMKHHIHYASQEWHDVQLCPYKANRTQPDLMAQYIDIEMQCRSINDIVAYGTATVFYEERAHAQTYHKLGLETCRSSYCNPSHLISQKELYPRINVSFIYDLIIFNSAPWLYLGFDKLQDRS